MSLHVAAVDELIDFAVAVAGDVAEHRVPRRPLVEAVDRHHGKELLDRPTVGHRLKEREIAEVGVREQRVEPFQLFGHEVQLLGQTLDLLADRPKQILGHGSLVERQIAGREQRHRHVHRLLGVVQAFQHVAGGDALDTYRQDRTAAARNRPGISSRFSSPLPWPATPSVPKTEHA